MCSSDLQETRSTVEWLTLQIEYFLKNFRTQILTEKPPQPPTSTITMPALISCLHPANPSDFDGDRSKGRAFLNSCELYALCLSDFANDHSCVLWTLSFMKTGRANSFIEQTLQCEVRRGPQYTSYAAFQTVFIEKFCPANEAWRAIMHLESHKYHQGS